MSIQISIYQVCQHRYHHTKSVNVTNNEHTLKNVNIPIILYHMDVNIQNNNETEDISTYHKDVNIQQK